MSEKVRKMLAKHKVGMKKVSAMGEEELAKWRAAGYITAEEAAKKCGGMHVGSMYRWIADEDVESEKVKGVRLVKVSSLVEKVGEKAAAIYGLIPAPPAAAKK